MGTMRPKLARRVATAVAALTCSTFMLAVPAGAQTASPNAATQNVVTPNVVTPPVISTYAGNGSIGFSGDGGPATSAKLFLPTGVAEDLVGNVYIGDSANNRVRKITTAGIISTVAGNGDPGFSGDGGLAKNAKIFGPTGVAIDASGNLYIADTLNNRIRKVNAGGIISTIAGTGPCALSGNGGPATSAKLCLPSGVAVDGSNVYVADSGNNQVRKITAAGVITAFAGTGSAGSTGDGGPATSAKLILPTGVGLDAAHNAYIADTGNNKVRKVNTAGVISTFAGTGIPGYAGDGNLATLARLNHPTGVGIDPLGNVYISDTFNNRIRVVIPKGDIQTYAGTGVAGFSGDGGPATAAKLNAPTGAVAADAHNVFFADTGNQRVRRIVGGPPPNIPETPFTVALLPLSALAMIGGIYLFMRRRNSRRLITT